MAVKVSAAAFVQFLIERWKAGDGYIMGATGQNPRNWSATSWWFTQYSGSQRTKALQWRARAPRVWDCNGLAEGYYKDKTGKDINARARNNFSTWCSPKGSGKIPTKYRVPGAAVFIHNGSYISHVGFLWKPVVAGKPEGDWWVIEARGVMYGCVKTRLNSRGWNRWGLMTKYFDYEVVDEQDTSELGQRILKKGDEGPDVKQLQLALISLGFSCGKWGADGEFGSATHNAVVAFQTKNNFTKSGVVDKKTVDAINACLPENGDDPIETPVEKPSKLVEITGGTVYVRTQPNTSGAILGVVKAKTKLTYRGDASENGWLPIVLDDEDGWVSGKYARVVDE